MRLRPAVLALLVSALPSMVSAQSPGAASSGYLLPPKVIVDMLDAPPPPTAEVSPARDVIALLERASMPSIAELSQPFYRLAGVRINPRTNAPHRGQRYRDLTLKVIADNSTRKVTLPASAAPLPFSWLRVRTVVRRHGYVLFRSPHRWFDICF